MDHLPKGDLKTLDNLALYLQEIMSLPTDKKKIIDPKMKLIGTDIKRSLGELLQGPQNFLQGEIELPDMEDPKAIKSFLYKMQGQGRRGRDQLNLIPGKHSSLINQHHIGGLSELMPNYAGKTAEEAFEIGKSIYEATGVWPGSHGGNLVEISGHRSIHLDAAHGGSYTGQKIVGSAREMLEQTKGAIKLNLTRASDAQKLSEPLYAWGRKMWNEAGFDPGSKDPFYLNGLGELTEDFAGQVRKAITKGERIIYGGPISNQQLLKEAGLELRADFIPGAEEIGKAIAQNPLEAVTGAAMNLADPDAIKSLFQGEPKEALEKGAFGAGIGAGIAEVLKVNPVQQARLTSYASKIPGVASQLPKALSFVGGAARFVGPASTAVAGYQLADAILEGSTGEGFVGTIQQVQDKKRTAKINKAAVESAKKSKQLAVEKELPKPIMDSDTIEKFVTDPLNEFEWGWKKLTGQV